MMKRSIWALYCDKPHGGYLFHGNPNPPDRVPQFHLGSVENLICGESLVCAKNRKTLEMDMRIIEWNSHFPMFRVKPKSIMLEIRPYYKKERGKSK